MQTHTSNRREALQSEDGWAESRSTCAFGATMVCTAIPLPPIRHCIEVRNLCIYTSKSHARVECIKQCWEHYFAMLGMQEISIGGLRFVIPCHPFDVASLFRCPTRHNKQVVSTTPSWPRCLVGVPCSNLNLLDVVSELS